MDSSQPIDSETMEVGWNLFILMLAIGTSAFFAATETAVISLNDAKIQREAEEGNRIAGLLRQLIDQPSRFRATVQIGMALPSLLAAAFATTTLALPFGHWLARQPWWHFTQKTAIGLTTTTVTVLLVLIILVFGDRLPKRIGMQRGETWARTIAYPFNAISAIARPFTTLLTFCTNHLLSLLGIAPSQLHGKISEEEIRMMLDIGGETGSIEPQEKEMIENVFEFNNTTAAEIMVHRKSIIALPIDIDNEECRETIRESGFSRIPVYNETIDNIQGILNTRDYLIQALDDEHPNLTKLLRKAFFVPETIRADILFRQMQKNKQGIAIVLDEYGGTSGLVSIEDLLEEIVGEIYDEYDIAVQTPGIECLSDTDYRMPGETDIDSAAETLNVEIEEGDFNTLGGFIFEKLNSMPTEGTKLVLHDLALEMTVEKMDDHRIESVRIIRISPTTPPAADAEQED